MGFLFQISNTGFVSWLQCCCCFVFFSLPPGRCGVRPFTTRLHLPPPPAHTFPPCPLGVRASSLAHAWPTPGQPRPHVAPPAVQCLPPDESGSVSFTFSRLVSSKIVLFSGTNERINKAKTKQKPVQPQLGSTSGWTLNVKRTAVCCVLCPVFPSACAVPSH